jgi:predicted CoA-substrate-specific enzyme activase
MDRQEMAEQKLFCGVDVGASATKAVLIDERGEVRAQSSARTGTDVVRIAAEQRDRVLAQPGLGARAVARTCATGYARSQVTFADLSRTEITCHSRGCLHHLAGPMTIVDIGGQDNKIIKIDAQGKRQSFKLNRKCAAGTGAFLEEIAELLDVDLDRLDELAQQATEPVKLGSFCTVFAKTEILTNFRRGDRVADIAAGAFESVVRRIIEMDPLDGNLVLTGGVVAHNPHIVGIFERHAGRPVAVPSSPQFTGALGAALIAREE